MVSVDRDYTRVMLFDPNSHSRQKITSQLTSPPQHPGLINPYLQSIDNDKTNGPYYFRVETISASNARGLVDMHDYKLPGVIVLSLQKQTMSAFVNVSTQLLDAKVHKRCPVVCVVGTSDLQFHQKLQRAIATAEQQGLTCAIAWNSEDVANDAQSGLLSLSARLKRVVHRTMCADVAFKQATSQDRHDNAREQEPNKAVSKSFGSQHAVNGVTSNSNSLSDINSNPNENNATSLAKMFATPPVSPIKKKRDTNDVHVDMFDFKRAGKLQKLAKQKRIAKSNRTNIFHRKHSLHGDDLKRYLGEPQLSDKMIMRLKGKVQKTKTKLRNAPVTAIFRDVLQPDYVQTPLPLQSTSKADSLTWRGFDLLYNKKLYRKSVIDLTICLQDAENHFFARFYRALAYATVGRFRQALRDMKKCLKLVKRGQVERGAGCDTNKRLLYVCNFNLAILHLNVHEHELSILCLEKCEKVDNISPDVALLRGFIRRRRGNYEKSRIDYVVASKLRLRQELGPAEAKRIEHSYSSKEAKQTIEDFQSVVRSPKKKSQILSFLSSMQKALITAGPDRNEMHMQYIAALLTNQTWFKKLSENLKMKLCRGIEYSTKETGEWVFRRGDYSTAFYLVMSGTLNIMVIDIGMSTETQAGTLSSQDTFGELGLLNNEDRSASISASAATEILTIPKLLFEECKIRQALEIVRQEKHEAIIRSNVLNGLPNKFLTDATDFATIRIYEQGSHIVRQGQHSESLFIVLQGVCDVEQKIDIREVLVHRRKQLVDQTESLKKKYVYHHQLIYNSAAPSNQTSNVYDDTLVESRMNNLEAELAILNVQIKELDRIKLAEYRKMSKWKRMQARTKSLQNGKDQMKKIRLAEIMTPSFFGEASMRGDGSLEHADVVASTRVVVLRIFMSQMDFSKVNNAFLDRLTNLSAVKTLSLEKLSARAKGEKGWTNYRKMLMKFVDKARWPVRNAHVSEGPMGISVIHELPMPRGSL